MLQWGAHAFFANKAIANGIIIPDAADIEEQTQVMLITAVFVDTSWTAIFCVKFSFLALFKMLIRNVSTRLSRYFWCVVVATALTWAFLVSETFILCSRFGWDSLKCSGPSTRLYTPLTALVTVLDIITDVLVVTFPIIILRHTQMDCKQKLGLCAFLCLSVIMILFAAIRVLGAIRPGEAHLDLPWEMFWQLMEACAAVMAASATVFRTVFLRHRRASSPRAAGDGAGGGDDAPPPSPEGERFEVLRTLRTRTPSGVGEEEKDKEGGMEVRECGSRGSEDEGGLLR
ncbi:hypothetical protein DBV05_g10173 [Lasiodiplodia theobromae]|uniref:Rhodopsin domain-containing protein n=1 Tax=Lasiodiplodia theobromae TaxID=45133 RepID=A0A5N5D0N7_9PEZI|nr:hypothetical protein DBV05_g10173 [Lasiodiplodia theobromae]